MAPSPRRPSRSSRPMRSSRMRVQSYQESSSGSDDNEDVSSSYEDQEFPGSSSLSLRPRRPDRMPRTYRESSTDQGPDDEGEDSDEVAPVELPANGSVPSRSRRSLRQTRSSNNRSSKPSSGRKRKRLGEPLKKRKKTEIEEFTFVGSGVIPPWQTLPYHVLFDIFYYASYPLVDKQTASRNSSVSWLAAISRLCRAFHEPALAALYYSPALLPSAKSHALLSLLWEPQESLSTNYVSKIKELHVDAESLLVYKSGPALGYFDLTSLIQRTPQLRKLQLYHKDDCLVGLPPWQIPPSKWTYPGDLFVTLNQSGIRLRSWDWNARFMETERLVPLILGNHREPAFNGLREVRMLHLNYSEDEDASNSRETVLATALKELPELRRLEFVECSIVNEILLSNLPSTLTSLTIDNCDDVATSNFVPFLATHGHNLRELILSHNRHLNMSFAVNLAQYCKQLVRFKMDLSIHDWSSYHDNEPHFKQLLGPSEIPTWPPTLQEIELIHLRKWDDVTAEAFFTSLIESAPDLKDLRKLIVSAILKIGWRDRANFRERWIGKLENVFLRRSPPPDPGLRTLTKPPIMTETQQSDTHNSNEASTQELPLTPSKRKSARIAQQHIAEMDHDTDGSQVSNSTSVAARGIRERDQPIKYVQGMCDVVMIRIDNSRPAETQFNEDDFLDDELSGDEDWDGNDPDPDGGGHAW
ncbi:conserved hypothetical protein [Paecilomyces variotii No. 5]|uniref:Uncharacterized protein n=1 Tax=Byssochlamys spectabilis (strain No. 5 / NBRC 109023) TaxID=1356009 RepID=V5G7M0_BYSSN|nr:conserved hypothetical protein [Paecilomyces variotii No. 5]